MESFMTPIEYKGQVVITTAQLAEVYGTTSKNITNNFQRNNDRFTEGKHYFILKGDELKEYKSKTSERGVPVSSANSMYLWTRRGASRHCKILGTDKAWEQFDYLEDNYFEKQPNSIPLTTAQQIQLLAQGNVELNQRVDTLTERMDKIELDLPLLPLEAEQIKKAANRKAVSTLGGKLSSAYHNRSLCQKVYNNIYANLKYNFKVSTYKALKRSQCDRAVQIINEWKPPVFLADEIANCNAQMTLDI